LTLLLCMLLAMQPRFLGPPEKDPDAGTVPAVQVGDAAPPLSGELEIPAGGERSFDLAAIVGPAATDPARAVLIAFFAPACAGCADELRVVRQLAAEYGPRGLRAVVVDVGADGHEVASRALADAQGAAIRMMGDRWQAWARRWLGARPQLPALFVVDRDGTVRATAGACGREAVASLGAAIQRALGGG
jgi:peroxiredoxin